MKNASSQMCTRQLTQQSGSFFENLSRKFIIKQLSGLIDGHLVIHESGEESHFIGTDNEDKIIHIHIEHSSFWTDTLLGGSTGAAEAYMQGSWKCSNLVSLGRLFLRNTHVLNKLDQRLTRLTQPIHKFIHWKNKNSKTGSRKNISEHYDLGNDFFSLFLDKSMMYSSAFYKNRTSDLEQAASDKLDRICQKLNLISSDHVLEIGTGWGGFAMHAAKKYGCKVTTATISKEQFELANQRIQLAGLSDQIKVILRDYRDIKGQYDKVVSIEMIEAVGHQYLDTYFAKCSKLLKPSGLICIQAITISDQHYHDALKEVDFIKKYIFPGGFLPSITAMSQSISKVSDFKIVHLEDIGYHYARTLSDWRSRFHAKIDEVKAQGFSNQFIRMWEFYLCYCESGFRENYLGTVQLVASKPNAAVPSFNPEIQALSFVQHSDA